MKKIISLILSFCMSLSLGAGVLSGCNKEDGQSFKNIILVIGDGMGENHILNTIDYYDLETPAFVADKVGYLNTNSLSGTTDSAASATALATGVKVKNSELAKHNDVDLEQITTIAQKANMKTGIITTDVLSGATPAGFSAHAEKRSFTNKIIQTQATSGINLFLGRFSSDYTNRSYYFEDEHYDMVRTQEDMFKKQNTEKLVGIFGNIDSKYIPTCEDDFQLKDMADFAIKYLENDEGFFLMIEGAYVDKHSHNEDINKMMAEMRALIDTIEFLYEYAANGETAVFITADHETGGLARANSKEEITDALYSSGDHTATPVPLYVKNYVWTPAGSNQENTAVFDACKSIIKNKK